MSKLWAPAPPPPTKLGFYRQLSALAGVHVSPLQLGGMSIEDKWAKFGMGAMDKEPSFALLDAFYDAGGNFIDTANPYQDESSEESLGEWMEKRGTHDQIVLATKRKTEQVHYTGNNVKPMHISVAASLKKLRTSYIDILYVHYWDFETSMEEVMNGLHNLVTSGKVLYLGISDTPAWIASKANLYAWLTGKTPFVIYQGAWSILQRNFERDILPMALSEGLALAPWNVLAAGWIRTDGEEEQRRQTGENGRTMSRPNWERTEPERKVCKALEEVQTQVGAQSIQAVAIAYVMQKAPFVFPIVGGRKKEQLEANIEALDVALSAAQIAFLEGVLPFDPGFPNVMVGDGRDYTSFTKTAGNFVKMPKLQAIRP